VLAVQQISTNKSHTEVALKAIDSTHFTHTSSQDLGSNPRDIRDKLNHSILIVGIPIKTISRAVCNDPIRSDLAEAATSTNRPARDSLSKPPSAVLIESATVTLCR
jgi:hypothetical protein